MDGSFCVQGEKTFNLLSLSEVHRCRAGYVVDLQSRPLLALLVLDIEREVLTLHIDRVVSAEAFLVGREDRHILAGLLYGQLVVGKRDRGVPVED